MSMLRWDYVNDDDRYLVMMYDDLWGVRLS